MYVYPSHGRIICYKEKSTSACPYCNTHFHDPECHSKKIPRNTKKDNVFQDLKRACPDGVDCSFENVAGEIMDETLRVLNPFSRIALCGFMSSYNTTEPYNLKNLRFRP